jgi:hypothetical protein
MICSTLPSPPCCILLNKASAVETAVSYVLFAEETISNACAFVRSMKVLLLIHSYFNVLFIQNRFLAGRESVQLFRKSPAIVRHTHLFTSELNYRQQTASRRRPCHDGTRNVPSFLQQRYFPAPP